MLLKNQLAIKNVLAPSSLLFAAWQQWPVSIWVSSRHLEPFIHHTWHLHIENIILYAHAFQATLETMIAA